MNTRQVLTKGMATLEITLMGLIEQIHQAYLKTDAGLTINLAIKIEPTKDQHIVTLETMVAFVESRIKESYRTSIDERQDELFKAVEKLRPEAGNGIDEISISHEGKTVILKATPEKKMSQRKRENL